MPRPASTQGLPTVSAPALLAHATVGAFLTPAAPFLLGGGVGRGGAGGGGGAQLCPENPPDPQLPDWGPSL